MFGKGITLFKLLGFEVRVDASWIILAVFITWSLAFGYFPHTRPGLSNYVYWTMGIVGTLGLFISIIFHELSHALVARDYQLPIKGITLFIFGGVAEMEKESPNPKIEFLMTLVGPLSSAVLGFFFYFVRFFAVEYQWPLPIQVVLSYLFVINLLLAAFNLLPAFPLDGGRLLRSALWAYKKNLRWATRISSSVGSGFSWILIFFGLAWILLGNFLGGLWWLLIGIFLKGASHLSYQQLLMQQLLKGEPVQRLMSTEVITVSPTTTIENLVQDYIYQYHHKLFPVVEDSKTLGYILLFKTGFGRI
jgi:Zn-dependent protease